MQILDVAALAVLIVLGSIVRIVELVFAHFELTVEAVGWFLVVVVARVSQIYVLLLCLQILIVVIVQL